MQKLLSSLVSLWARLPRLYSLMLITVAALVLLYFIAPQQLPVALYKLTLITLAALAGYWIDRLIFPYARPDSYLVYDWREHRKTLPEHGDNGNVDYLVVPDHHHVFAAAMLRRALIMIAIVLGVALGL